MANRTINSANQGTKFTAIQLALIFIFGCAPTFGDDIVSELPRQNTEPRIGMKNRMPPVATDANRPQTIDFYRDIKPIFIKHCFACHGPSKSEAGLRLDMRLFAFKGGDDGPVIAKGDSAASMLIQYVTGKNAAGLIMPPQDKAPPLAQRQIDLLRAWIDAGAPWPQSPDGKNSDRRTSAEESDSAASKTLSDHWAFQDVRRERPPAMHNAWIDNPVDAFVLAKLREHHLEPNSRASRTALIRRVTFDLTGLPPTPEDVQTFAVDNSDDAYSRLVDRLLASPQYGEHWARHWLDLARYADSDGFENDTDRPFAYKYRDYVIRSFNDDKPYDQFVLEQIAGDELNEPGIDRLIALGFCRNGPTIGNQINEKNRVDEIDDIVSTTSAVFLGLTLGCARCHDHKYEPISQRDYYRMFAVFNNLKKVHDDEIMCVRQSGSIARPNYVMLGGDYTRHGEEVRAGVPAVLDHYRTQFPEPTHAEGTSPQSTQGCRLALARWIVDPRNPLTARVIANRVWMYHFGRGLVDTPSNLGQSGDFPTHLELLDYMAGELVRGGWRLKPLHKMIVMSATYRQSSDFDAIKSSSDADDEWYWHFPLRRLQAEEIRDSILAASGKLDLRMYGPGVKPKIPDSILATTSKEMWPTISKDGADEWRRSVYIFVKRSVLLPMLEGFDAPTATQSCERRMTTTVATQALALLNDEFSNDQARYMADRVIHDVGEDTPQQIDRAYWLAFSRAPTLSQRREACDFVARQFENYRHNAIEHHHLDANAQSDLQVRALADLCHVLFNSNEFLYVN